MVTRYKNIDVEIELDEEGYNISYRQVLASSEILIKQLVNY